MRENFAFEFIRIYFQVKDFWIYGNLTRNIRDLTRFGKTRHLGTNRFNERKRIGKISQSVEHINCIWLQVKDFWFYGNLTGNIRDLTRFGKTRRLGTNWFNERKRIGKISQSVECINSFASDYRYSCPCGHLIWHKVI